MTYQRAFLTSPEGKLLPAFMIILNLVISVKRQFLLLTFLLMSCCMIIIISELSYVYFKILCYILTCVSSLWTCRSKILFPPLFEDIYDAI